MAAYAAVADVQGEFKSITFTSSTTVTDTQVTRFITEAEAEINGCVGLVYQVPVDSVVSPIAFALLRSLSISIVSTRIKNIVEVKTNDQGTSQGGGPKSDADNARKILDKIVAQTLKLIDAVKVNATRDGVESFASNNAEPLVFQKDCQQW